MEEDYYWDDPAEEEVSGGFFRGKFPTAILVILSLIGATFFIRTTLASNITISAAPFEFGQGVSVQAACAGSTNIIVTPAHIFANVSNGGSFKLDTITVSNIPQSCFGTDFTLSLYPDSSNTAVNLFYGATSLTLYNNSGTFTTLASAANYVSLTSSSTTCIAGGSCNSVRAVINWPTVQTSSIAKIAVQSGSHVGVLSCASGGSCSIGETGPGGGYVFFYSAAGFNCGASFTSTGSPAGGLCHYLEAAPKNWSGGADPTKIWAISAYSSTNVVDVNDEASVNLTTASLGLGYKNSAAIVSQGNDNTTAAYAARNYLGASLNDWYLPTSSEANLLCQFANGLTLDLSTPCTAGSINSGIYGGQNAGFTNSRYWTSSESNSGNAWTQSFSFNSEITYPKIGYNLNVRPIRAF